MDDDDDLHTKTKIWRISGNFWCFLWPSSFFLVLMIPADSWINNKQQNRHNKKMHTKQHVYSARRWWFSGELQELQVVLCKKVNQVFVVILHCWHSVKLLCISRSKCIWFLFFSGIHPPFLMILSSPIFIDAYQNSGHQKPLRRKLIQHLCGDVSWWDVIFHLVPSFFASKWSETCWGKHVRLIYSKHTHQLIYDIFEELILTLRFKCRESISTIFLW